MKIITSDDINYDNVEALSKVFSSFGLDSVAKEPQGYDNAKVDITFPSTKDNVDLKVVVMVWVRAREPDILRLRVALFDKSKRDTWKKNTELWKQINEVGEMLNESAFGYLSLSNMAGITFDYSLTIEGGIADSTLASSAKEIARIAQGAKSSINRAISFFG